ncbi:redox-sensing transcriptional repressor Rex [Pseudoflavonifractor phocaeensis]|uniref:redox-sensing transcriptional repressor Rex n=1 Tax=Pseudoflavonifractor phocaeensis TaxID=1870988 RepID=UPI0030883F8D|nr:redox-sensing transcriptional repressor Rex [Oscillospiraceae bacterium]
MKKQKVSSAVIRRLPRYYRHLTDLYLAGVVRISSSALGKSMNLTASQIRQDLSCFGEFGQQGYGYNVESLRDEIAEILGMNQKHTAVILGVGNLGRALMENFHFDRSGFTLTAAFDVDPNLIGKSVSDVQVHPVEELERYLRETSVSVGVLTVPRAAAAPMSERLVAGGVKGIWNFTNAELDMGRSGVVVENVHFADSLLALSYMISEAP